MKIMTRKFAWLGLVLALAVPAGLAWASNGTAPAAEEHSCCCHKACPK